MARIGFIGLGRMGTPIVDRLIGAGHQLTVWNRTPGKAEELEGVSLARSPADLAEASEIVFTMVSNAAALEAVLTGGAGLLSAETHRPAIFDMTTISPADSRNFARIAKDRGFVMLDAPVAGGPPVAANGELGMMVGGDPETLETWRPVLEAFTSKIVHAGHSGQGSALKLINNLVLATALQASAEALVFARKCGIDPEKVIEINSSGGAQLRMMQTRGPRMIAHDFSPAANLDLIHKDVSAAVALADEVGAALPAGTTVLDMIRAGRARGAGELDMAALVTVIEALAGLEPD